LPAEGYFSRIRARGKLIRCPFRVGKLAAGGNGTGKSSILRFFRVFVLEENCQNLLENSDNRQMI
jgi:hypothetical protein